MLDLTLRQQRIFDFIEAEVHAGRPTPTLREIAQRFGFRAHRAAACHLAAIKKKGFIKWDKGKARSLRLIRESKAGHEPIVVRIPVFGTIPAGFGVEKKQESEGCLMVDVNTIGFKPTRTTFALKVTGDSMIGRQICGGDIVILEHGPKPLNNQIVAALIDRKSTLKTFLLKDGKPLLKAENPKYPDLIPSEDLMIQGVFRALIRKSKG